MVDDQDLTTGRIQQQLRELARKLEVSESERAKLVERSLVEQEKHKARKMYHDQALNMFKQDKNSLNAELENLREKLLKKEVVIAGLRVEIEKLREMSELGKLINEKHERTPTKQHNTVSLRQEVLNAKDTQKRPAARSRSSSERQPKAANPSNTTQGKTPSESVHCLRRPSSSTSKPTIAHKLSQEITRHHRPPSKSAKMHNSLFQVLEDRVQGLKKELRQEKSVNQGMRDKIEGVVLGNQETCSSKMESSLEKGIESQKRLFLKIVSKASRNPSVWEYFNSASSKQDTMESKKQISVVESSDSKQVTHSSPPQSKPRHYTDSTAANTASSQAVAAMVHQKEHDFMETAPFSSGTTVREKERDTHVMILQKQGGVSSAFNKIADRIKQIKEAI